MLADDTFSPPIVFVFLIHAIYYIVTPSIASRDKVLLAHTQTNKTILNAHATAN